MWNSKIKARLFAAAIGLALILAGCRNTTYIDVYQASTDVSGYAPNDNVFESISVPYQECNPEFTVYVSPAGNNENDGLSLENAVSSVKQAQILTRKYLDNGGKGDCLIFLDDGEYFLSGPLQLTKQDVINENKLYIRAINPNKATLTGSKKVEATSVIETEDENLGRVWKIPCNDNINQLYINNGYAVRARYPDVGEELRLLNWDTTLRTVIIDSEDIKGFEYSDFEGSTFTPCIMWAESYMRVSYIENNGKTSLINFPVTELEVFLRNNPMFKERQNYHFENSKAFLSVCGEWYFSKDENIVYYIPYESETLADTEIRIPYTEELLTLSGSETSYAENILIEGLNFKWTNNRHIDGKIGNQANTDNGSNKRFAGTVNNGRPISAISLKYSKNVLLSGNIFACLGGGALDFIEGVQDVTVEKNVFRAVGGNGILASATSFYVDDVSDNESSFIKNVKIENNYFTDIAWQEYGGCPVVLNYAVDCKISHNTINNAKYTGISVGWGWKEQEYPFLKNNEISYNKVTNVVTLLSDGAAIYTIGCQPNSVMKDNYIDNVFNSVYKYPNDLMDGMQIMWATSGIYLDQGTGGTTDGDKVLVTNNVLVKDNIESEPYCTLNAKTGYYEITEPKEADKNAIIAQAGVKENGFTLLPKTAALYGTHTKSAEQVSIFGDNLGKSSENILVLKGKDGKLVQLSAYDVVSWEDEKITFKTGNYLSGDVFLLNKSGSTSNKIVVTCNVDENYCMYERFENEWGGLSGLTRLITQRQDLKVDGFKSSSQMDGWPASAIDDNDASTGWSSNEGDGNPWVSFELDGISTVEKIIIYARLGFNQEECRRNFNIIGIDEQGKELLVYKANRTEPVFEPNGLLTVNISDTEYKQTLFKGFRITRPEGDDMYFFVAEVAII